MTTTFFSLAMALRRSVEGPGMDSAVSKRACSSRWQKYWARKSSGRQMTLAPARAASRTRSAALSRLAAVSGPQDIWMRPMRLLILVLLFVVVMMILFKFIGVCEPRQAAGALLICRTLMWAAGHRRVWDGVLLRSYD